MNTDTPDTIEASLPVHHPGPPQLSRPDHVQSELPGVSLSPMGASITGPVDWEATIGHLETLKDITAACRWQTGDMLLALAADAGGDWAPVYAALEGKDLDARATLQRSVAVANRVPMERRRPELSWAHHEVVAAIVDPEMQSAWLAAAISDVEGGKLPPGGRPRWSAHRLAAEIRKALPVDKQPELADERGPLITPHLTEATVAKVNRIWAGDPGVAVVIRPDGGVAPLLASTIAEIVSEGAQ